MDGLHDALVAAFHGQLPHGPLSGPVGTQIRPQAGGFATARKLSPLSKKRAITGKEGNWQEEGMLSTKEIRVARGEK